MPWEDHNRLTRGALTIEICIRIAEQTGVITRTTGKALRATLAGGVAAGTGIVSREAYNLIRNAIPNFAAVRKEAMKRPNELGIDVNGNVKRPRFRGGESEGDSVPSLGDLLPDTQGTPRSESQASRDQSQRSDRARGHGTMNEDGDEPMGLMATSTNQVGNKVSKETPVSIYPTLTYGLQETHTTILPYKTFCMVNVPVGGNGTKLELRMNSPYDPFITTVSATTIVGAGPGSGVYGEAVVTQNQGATWGAKTDFPLIPTSGQGDSPAWRQYFSQLYEYYTVLGCKYKIIMKNPVGSIGGGVLVAYEFDSYVSQTGNVLPDMTLGQLYQQKGISYETINPMASQYPNTNTKIIEGQYQPGDCKRNIRNDGDVQLWTKTGTAQVPTLTESLHMRFYRDPLTTTIDTYVVGLNIEIQMDYIVQFKDLRVGARYPSTGASTITQTLPAQAYMIQGGTIVP